MKNFNKMIAGIILTVMMSMSTVMADPGILLSDRQTIPTVPAACEVKPGDADNGIIVFGLIEGIIVFGRTGIIVFGKSDAPACEAK